MQLYSEMDSCNDSREGAEIYGHGTISRDFCYVANEVQANLLAAISVNPDAQNKVFNVALNKRTSLEKLHALN